MFGDGRDCAGVEIGRRKGRESNPQGVAAKPFSRRSPAPMGWPFRRSNNQEGGI